MYINVSSTSSLSDDEDDVPAFAYYIIAFGLGLLIGTVILIAVYIFCCNIRDRWYKKSECVSTRHVIMLSWDYQFTYVTRSAKTDHVRTKIEIHFLAQLIAVLNSYPHTMSAMARLKWSAFLRGEFTAL